MGPTLLVVTDAAQHPTDDEEQDEARPRPWESDPDGFRRSDFVPKDWTLDVVLHVLTGELDDAEGSATVTLVIDGVVVSGTLISGVAYAATLRERLAQNTGPQDVTDMASIFEIGHRTQVESLTRRKQRGLALPRRRFLHMRDVRVYTGGSSIDMPLFRGRLDRVSGWSFGGYQS